MSLCRHLLLRVNHCKRTDRATFSRRLLSSNHPPSSSSEQHDFEPARDGTSAELPPPTSKTSREGLPLPPLLLHPIPNTSRNISFQRPSATAPDTYSAASLPSPGLTDRLDAYQALRARDVTAARDLSAEVLLALTQDAANAKLGVIMDHLATDVLDNFHGREKDSRRVAAHILNLGASLLSNDKLRCLLLILENQEDSSFKHIWNRTAVYLTKTLIADLAVSDASLPTLLKLVTRSLRAPKRKSDVATNPQPSRIGQLSYFLVHKLLQIGRDQQALDVFQMLVSTGNIPPEAIHQMKSTDSSFIILSTLTRSCLHWGWRRSAVDLCKHLLRVKMTVAPEVVELCLDVAYGLLETPTPVDLSQCALLVREIDMRAPAHQLPDGIFRGLYQAAYELNQGRSAEILYEHTQSATFINRNYPTPEGRALTWLMRHLAVTSCNKYLGRQLTKHVVESFEPIPLQDRASFIALAASSGLALPARTLWERYSVGKHRDTILSNSSTMLRMVSCFMHVKNKVDTLLGETSPGANLDHQTHLDDPDERPLNEEEELAQEDSKIYQERLKDVGAFIDRIIAEFRSCKEPLAQANHADLTSLARAYFMTGNVTAGFDAFRVLLNRKEIPDLHDINVALSAMAEYTPRGAARMVERMVSKGIHPDSVTFGTIIHFATIHRDTALVSTLVNRARQLDDGQLSLKSVQSLIRASLEMENTSQSQLRMNLQRALAIVKTMTKSAHLSPNTGKYCVAAALKVQEPTIAYRFWKLLVVRKLDWEDGQHKFLRQRMKSQLRRHVNVNGDRVRAMIHELGKEPMIYGTK